MNKLTLSIENQIEPDLGVSPGISVTGKSISAGRKANNDWILPDPTRHISSRHFEISFDQGRYLLRDASTNGTFVNGAAQRVEGLHEVTDQDQIKVGRYIIRAKLSRVEAPAPAPAPAQEIPPPSATAQDKPKLDANKTGVQAPPSMAARSPIPAPAARTPVGTRTQTPDFSSLHSKQAGITNVSGPPIQRSIKNLSVPPIPKDEIPQVNAESGVSVASETPVIPEDMTIALGTSAAPTPLATPTPVLTNATEYTPTQSLGLGERFGDPSAAPQSPPSPAAPPVETVQAPEAQSTPQADQDLFLRGFIEGAGIANPNALQISPQDLGHMLGQCARLGTQELMQMLQDRGAIKFLVSPEGRTMRISTGNNPMKFMPDPEQAFETMFVNPRDGYLTGADGFANALGDIRKNQAALMAAIQPAISDMLDGLAPAEIEEDTGSGMLGGGGRKCWDEYTKRWNSRAEQGENGILDAFLGALSRRYAEALDKL